METARVRLIRWLKTRNLELPDQRLAPAEHRRAVEQRQVLLGRLSDDATWALLVWRDISHQVRDQFFPVDPKKRRLVPVHEAVMDALGWYHVPTQRRRAVYRLITLVADWQYHGAEHFPEVAQCLHEDDAGNPDPTVELDPWCILCRERVDPHGVKDWSEWDDQMEAEKWQAN